MRKKQKIFFTTTTILLALSLHSPVALASEIEIKPVLEGQGYYVMKLGETQTFEAYGIGWDEEREEKIPDVAVNAIRWNFDLRFLELVEKSGAFITLKAIKKRTSKLTATGKINDDHAAKTIFIVIGETE